MNNKAKYFLKRALQSFLVVFALTIVTFIISINTPIDPVDAILENNEIGTIDPNSSKNIDLQRQLLREKMGYNLPAFYFKIGPSTLAYKYYDLGREDLRSLLHKNTYLGYNGKLLLQYLKVLETEILQNKTVSSNENIFLWMAKNNFYSDLQKHQAFLAFLKTQVVDTEIHTYIKTLETNLQEVFESQSKLALLLPVVYFYPQNQYHIWLFGNGNTRKGIIRGDFGKSLVNGKSALSRIKKSLPWTFVLSAISVFISIVFSIFIGLLLGYFQNKWWSNGISSLLFLVYTVPSFWLATLLLVFFANPDYFNWFPPGGIKPVSSYNQDLGFWQQFGQSAAYLVLPVICLTYSSLAVVTRLLRSSTIESLQSLYVFSARARGLKEGRVLWKHVWLNVLLPLITISAGIIPSLFGGSVIIESIFSIPGLGYELYRAILQNDINVVMAIFTITAILSALGYLISDVLYTIFDPRIRLEKL